ncbi:phosphohydrolase [Lampropedia puyangensis]|uniref:Phosphohydrolase n=1 Tax=Lampropedia puyangensis TaxID=1330072 RepID=A0A4S8ETN8_9BURK|nr:TraI domain-containing protein [Lampropedia puyangensis]THT98122.1 phosphohydrolase [Lampropedia puyangensis]
MIHPESEYLVEFTPKAARDYSAHARLAQLLLPRIAPPSAMSFLSMMPKALEALERYLTGADKDSLVAKIVKKADARSAQRALSHGSQARFATAKAVPLYDLLMQAIGAMLRSGTSLPLNRSGAAGWVYDGSVWFVAKRLADAVREWIHKNEPDQVVPGDTKNDRLFDTWQDYGVIERNPHTGQAVWYVHVEGHSQSEQGTYSHSLTMLRFPLAKLFADESQYPEAMTGRIVVRASRDGETEAIHDIETDAIIDAASHDHDATRHAGNPVQSDAVQASSDMKLKQGDDTLVDTEHKVKPRKADAKPVVKSPALKAPAFSKPSGTVKTAKPATKAPQQATTPKQPSSPPQTASTSSIHHAEQNDELDAVDAAYLLESSILSDVRGGPSGMDALRAAASQYSNERKTEATTGKRPQTASTATPTAAPKVAQAKQATEQSPTAKPPAQQHVAATPVNPSQTASNLPALAPISTIKTLSGLKPMTPLPKIVLGTGQPEVHAKSLDPVLLKQDLPRLSGQQNERQAEPSELATDFMRWVQQSLVDRSLKFNETGAAVHFVPEGMAVVSPLIFKQYAGTLTTDLSKVPEMAKQVQRDVIKADWHLPGPNKSNIVRYAVIRGQEQVSTLSVVVFVNAGRWVQPVPPSNPVLQLM